MSYYNINILSDYYAYSAQNDQWKIYLHKIILCQNSLFFKKILLPDNCVGQIKECINITDLEISECVCETIFKYIYSQKLELDIINKFDIDKLIELLIISDMFNIDAYLLDSIKLLTKKTDSKGNPNLDLNNNVDRIICILDLCDNNFKSKRQCCPSYAYLFIQSLVLNKHIYINDDLILKHSKSIISILNSSVNGFGNITKLSDINKYVYECLYDANAKNKISSVINKHYKNLKILSMYPFECGIYNRLANSNADDVNFYILGYNEKNSVLIIGCKCDCGVNDKVRIIFDDHSICNGAIISVVSDCMIYVANEEYDEFNKIQCHENNFNIITIGLEKHKYLSGANSLAFRAIELIHELDIIL